MNLRNACKLSCLSQPVVVAAAVVLWLNAEMKSRDVLASLLDDDSIVGSKPATSLLLGALGRAQQLGDGADQVGGVHHCEVAKG